MLDEFRNAFAKTSYGFVHSYESLRVFIRAICLVYEILFRSCNFGVATVRMRVMILLDTAPQLHRWHMLFDGSDVIFFLEGLQS